METIKSVMERIEKMPEEVNVDAVFGEPRTVEGRVVIPVAQISYAFGAGAGGSEAESAVESAEEGEEHPGFGGGGGGGAHARPIAYIEVGPEGTQVKSIQDDQKIALAGIFMVAWTVGWLGLVLKTIFGRR